MSFSNSYDTVISVGYLALRLGSKLATDFKENRWCDDTRGRFVHVCRDRQSDGRCESGRAEVCLHVPLISCFPRAAGLNRSHRILFFSNSSTYFLCLRLSLHSLCQTSISVSARLPLIKSNFYHKGCFLYCLVSPILENKVHAPKSIEKWVILAQTTTLTPHSVPCWPALTLTPKRKQAEVKNRLWDICQWMLFIRS